MGFMLGETRQLPAPYDNGLTSHPENTLDVLIVPMHAHVVYSLLNLRIRMRSCAERYIAFQICTLSDFEAYQAAGRTVTSQAQLSQLPHVR